MHRRPGKRPQMRRAGGAGAAGGATGTTVESLARSAIQLVSNKVRRFRNELWQNSFVVPAEARVCPICLAEDEAEMPAEPAAATWKLRTVWTLRPVTVCLGHEVTLLDVAPNILSTQKVVDLATMVASAGGIRRLQAAADRARPDDLQAWIHNRVAGMADQGGPWLALQTNEQGVRACGMLGAVHLHGPEARILEFSGKESGRVGQHGFDIAKDGESAIWDALTEIRSMSVMVSQGRTGHHPVYGSLYK